MVLSICACLIIMVVAAVIFEAGRKKKEKETSTSEVQETTSSSTRTETDKTESTEEKQDNTSKYRAELDRISTLYSNSNYYECWKDATNLMVQVGEGTAERKQARKIIDDCKEKAKGYYLKLAGKALLKDDTKEFNTCIGYLKEIYQSDKNTLKEIETFETENRPTEESKAFLNRLLSWAEDEIDNDAGTTYWTKGVDWGLYYCYHTFTIGDFDGDGKKELAVWRQEFESEIMHSALLENDLLLYRYNKKAKEVQEYDSLKVKSSPEDLKFSKQADLKFYSCNNDGLEEYYSDHYIRQDERLKALLDNPRHSFDEDRALYKELMDDIYDAIQRGDSSTTILPDGSEYPFENYSDILKEKWGGGSYGTDYDFIDLDSDGTRELILRQNGNIAAIYTYKNGKPLFVREFDTAENPTEPQFKTREYNADIMWSGEIVFRFNYLPQGGMGIVKTYLSDGKLVLETGYDREGNYRISTIDPYVMTDYDHNITQAEIEEIEASMAVDGYISVTCTFDTYKK